MVACLEETIKQQYFTISMYLKSAIKTGGLWLEGHYKREITVPIKPLSCKLKQMLPIKNMFVSVSRLVIRVSVLKLNATFNNMSVTSWRSVLLVEGTEVPRENHRPTASH